VPEQSNKVVIVLAIIGTISGWGTALITNWSKIAGDRPVVETPVKPGPGPEPRQLRKATVVLVDTAVPGNVYAPELKPPGNTNAHFLQRQMQEVELANLIRPVVDITDAVRPSALRIAKEKPDVVAIHRSAFEQVPDAEAALVTLLSELKDTHAVFLVYSRTKETNPAYAIGLQTKAGLAGRVFSYQFTGTHPFSEQATVGHFISTIRMLSESQLLRAPHEKLP
jgi:hypothetical protein